MGTATTLAHPAVWPPSSSDLPEILCVLFRIVMRLAKVMTLVSADSLELVASIECQS